MCEENACRECIGRYLLTITSPKCMFCQKPYPEGFVDTVMSKSYIKTKFKEHEQEIMLNMELSLMPSTQMVMERERDQRILEELRSLQHHSRSIENFRKTFPSNDCAICKRNKTTIACQAITCIMSYCIGCLKMAKATGQPGTPVDSSIINGCWGCDVAILYPEQLLKKTGKLGAVEAFMLEKQVFQRYFVMFQKDVAYFSDRKKELLSLQLDMRSLELKHNAPDTNLSPRYRCPRDCPGYLVDFRCGICTMEACSECYTSKEDEHKCAEDDVKTFEVLKQGTKPCPRCLSPIYKESGCDQMFCTMCHLVFSWATGKQELGAVHNPHHREFMEFLSLQTDEQIATLLNIDQLIELMSTARDIVSYDQRKMLKSFHTLTNAGIDAIRRCIIWDNIDLRKEYLKNELSKEQLLQKLVTRKKNNLAAAKIVNILEQFKSKLGHMLGYMLNDAITTWRPSEGETLAQAMTEYITKVADELDDSPRNFLSLLRINGYYSFMASAEECDLYLP